MMLYLLFGKVQSGFSPLLRSKVTYRVSGQLLKPKIQITASVNESQYLSFCILQVQTSKKGNLSAIRVLRTNSSNCRFSSCSAV